MSRDLGSGCDFLPTCVILSKVFSRTEKAPTGLQTENPPWFWAVPWGACRGRTGQRDSRLSADCALILVPHVIPRLLLLEPWDNVSEGIVPTSHISSVLSAFQIPGAGDSCGSEDSKGNLESPKQGNSKMKLKSRLSGKWGFLSDTIFLKTNF